MASGALLVATIFGESGALAEQSSNAYQEKEPGGGSSVRYLSPRPQWSAEGNQENAQFGIWVSSAGDVNGDGYNDVAVGSYLYDGKKVDEGKVFVYHGSPAGLSSTPAWSAEGKRQGAWFGYAVAAAGDVNRDGYDDLLVGAPMYDGGEQREGRVFLYYGSRTGLTRTAVWTAESDRADSFFGWSVAGAGDVNGDGLADFIVGAPNFGAGQSPGGAAFVYLGRASLPPGLPDWSIESNQAGAALGISVASAGDVNGDRHDDVIVGAALFDNGQYDEGAAFVFHGSPAGLPPVHDWQTEANQSGAWLGLSTATAGDVNGDGYDDAIVGAYFYDNGQRNEGAAAVFLGSPSGLQAVPHWRQEANQRHAWFGFPVASAGDVNGDGLDDVLVGAYLFDNDERNEGVADLFVGSAQGLSSLSVWRLESNQAHAQLGNALASAGDVNGDGLDDVIIGAFAYDRGETDEGIAWVFHGIGEPPLRRLPGPLKARR